MKVLILVVVALTVAAAAAQAATQDPRYWPGRKVDALLRVTDLPVIPGTTTHVVAAGTACLPILPRIRSASGQYRYRNWRCSYYFTVDGETQKQRIAIWVRPKSATAFCWSATTLKVLVANPRC